ncbi:MAG: hypothetical protein Kow0029_00660 [Candidatus Rifleibacteriota bacterium]
MKNCENCKLRLYGRHFDPELLRKIPLHLRRIFICDSEKQQGQTLFNLHKSGICPMDLWVLTYIGINDAVACANAGQTLENLVKIGASELICHLFTNASYEVRRELWLIMTEKFPDRLYLFDVLFEKEGLAPFEEEENANKMQYYKYSLLFGNSTSTAMFDDL